jgi:O-antigen/teichoic acid export membrane protein
MKNNYWRSVSSVLGGMALAQVIPFVASLVIARIYIPAEFGIYSIWLGIVSIVSVIVSGRLEQAVGLEDIGELRNKLTIAIAIFTLLACGLAGGILLVLYFIQSLWFATIPAAMVLILIPTALFLALSQLWQSLSACDGHFHKLSMIRIIQASSVAFAQIFVGLLQPSATSLSFAHCLGASLGVLIGYSILKLSNVRMGDFREELLAVKGMLIRYQNFLKFSVPAGSINTLSGYLPLFIISIRFGDEVTGWTALALRIFGAPIELLGGAVRDVFKNQSSEAYRERGECSKEYLHTFKVLLLCSLIAVPAFMLVSEWFFAFAFGEPWRQAGKICRWLAPMFAMRFIASPLSYTIYIAEKQNYDFIWQIALLLMTVGVFIVYSNYKYAIISYSVGYSVLYGFYCLMSYRFSKGQKQ